jgi:hypothetical protein
MDEQGVGMCAALVGASQLCDMRSDGESGNHTVTVLTG